MLAAEATSDLQIEPRSDETAQLNRRSSHPKVSPRTIPEIQTISRPGTNLRDHSHSCQSSTDKRSNRGVGADLDPASTDSLESAADGLGIDGRARCLTQDGLATIRDTSDAYAGDPADVLVHVDPFDPTAEIEPGLSAITLASELSRQGFKTPGRQRARSRPLGRAQRRRRAGRARSCAAVRGSHRPQGSRSQLAAEDVDPQQLLALVVPPGTLAE
jgi:hypothetical protein